MKWKIFLCVLSLVLLSGCLDMISTRQKQLCLSATHESQTTIYDCTKTSDCYKKVNSAGFVVSEKLNFNIKNQLLAYKNNVASAVYYFNKSRANIKNINEFCSGEEDVKIINNINSLFFNLSKTFEYQDASWLKSIELLKDYAIFLKENGVENISEEQVYDVYVVINQNLNELRGEETLSENYVSIVKEEAKHAQELAKKFGFKQSYMSEHNFVDLFAYYYEYVENPEKKVKLPIISKSSNYVFAKFSTMDNFLKINESLQGSDNYNLYLLFDKEFGSGDSLFTKFITLNNKINQEIDDCYVKINELETYIEDNDWRLSEEAYSEYLSYKHGFETGGLGFGYYLEKLKDINSYVSESMELEISENIERKTVLEHCDIVITEAKKYSNAYFAWIIGKYESETDIGLLEDYCKLLEDALSNKDCLSDYNKLVEIGFIEDTNPITEFDCIDMVNQANSILENNEKILLLKRIVNENLLLIREIEKLELGFSEEIELLNYKDSMKYIKNLANYKLIILIDDYLEEATNTNEKLEELLIEALEKELEETMLITYESGEYYLVLNNNSGTLSDVCFELKEGVSGLVSLDDGLTIGLRGVCVDTLISGINKFKVGYQNQRTIETRLIDIEQEDGLFETIVKNTCIGVTDTLNLGQITLLDQIKYTLTQDNYISYLTEPENKILYYKKIFERTELDTEIENMSRDYLVIERFRLKNITEERLCGGVALLFDCYDCVAIAKENGELKNAYIDNGELKVNTCFEVLQEKLFETQRVIDYTAVLELIEEINYKLDLLGVCEFEDIKKLATTQKARLEKYININRQLSLTDITEIYNIKTQAENIEREYQLRKDKVDSINLVLSKLCEFELTEKEIAELDAIESLKYNEPDLAYEKVINLYEAVLKRRENEGNLYSIDFRNKVNSVIEKAKLAGIEDGSIITKLNSLSFSESSMKEYQSLEMEIDKKIEEKARGIEELAGGLKEMDVREINKLIEQINLAYSGVSLKELYEVKYYPPVTLQDSERLEKKKEFLQTATFLQLYSKFQNSYAEQDYLRSVQAVSPDVLERLRDINKEITLARNGMAQIKEDSNKELYLASQKYKKPNEAQKSRLEKIKQDIDNGKLLLAIRNARLETIVSSQKEQPKLSYQVIVLCGVILVSAVFYVGWGKKKKALSKEEKKQKILRKY